MLVYLCHQLLSGFLANDHLPRESRQSANKGDNEMKQEAVHRFSGIFLATVENPGKPRLMGRATSHRLKSGPLPPNGVSRITGFVKKRGKETRNNGKGIYRNSWGLLS